MLPHLNAVLTKFTNAVGAQVVAGMVYGTDSIKLVDKYELVKAFENYGAAIVVEDITEVVTFANQIAPEHVELHLENPFEDD